MKSPYEVEFKATTYRTYQVEASSKEEAEELAGEQLDSDPNVSSAWREAAEVEMVHEFINEDPQS